ncbi:MAG: SWIM zinc finger family protein [Acidimicrobiales bacterium]
MSPRSRYGATGGGWYAPSRPLPASGGLVARSARGEIGEHWWSKRFVEVLESFSLGSRLTRGKSYARRGQVLSLDVAPGTVSATVQGSRRTPYKVTIGIAPFSELVWAKVEVVLAEQAVHSAHLLAGELPGELEEVFTAAGAPLFPARRSELDMSCSCPDWEVPCKHISATFYLLAESFDEDPFRVLHWRGRSREQLLGRLRYLRGGGPQPALASTSAAGGLPAAEDRRTIGAAMALADIEHASLATELTDPDRFWAGAAPPPLPSHPVLPADLVLRQLPPPPALLGGEDLVAELRSCYEGDGT